MTIQRNNEYWIALIKELKGLPQESEWVEFKENNTNPEEIGEYISALSNSAAILGKASAYLIWGIKDESHEIVGTKFKPLSEKKGNEDLQNWLCRLLEPQVEFHFIRVKIQNLSVVVLEIIAASGKPVRFSGSEYIRLGSYKKKLADFPEKERALWRTFDTTSFERKLAAENVSDNEVLDLIDGVGYFRILDRNQPMSNNSIIDALQSDDMITQSENGLWNITNLGAILLAKDLNNFKHLKSQAVRVIRYKGDNKRDTIKEQVGRKGYAIGFEGLLHFVLDFLPKRELVGDNGIRKERPIIPQIAIRELIANALIHQDFNVSGSSVMIEIFDERIEISNPGKPLLDVNRFLDSPPKSRNEKLASFMRRVGICEERGSGIDKVVFETEFHQLPAPIFEETPLFTRTVLFSHRDFKDLDKKEKIMACYLHASLKFVSRSYLTNTSLRKRFGVGEKNKAIISRLIKEATEAGLIKVFDTSVGPKARKYVPYWA